MMKIYFPLHFICSNDICFWIIRGTEFDVVGLYLSFQNGVWTINDWTISEFWCMFP
jgi:hypothetical protein